MAKGRRERDRPKAAPGASFNPNKRVKLTYDDSESEEEVAEKEQSPVIDHRKARVQQECGEESVQSQMQITPHKRKDDEVTADARNDEVDEEKPEAEQDPGGGDSANKTRKANAHTGQWHALGSLAWQDEGEGEDGGDEGVDPAAMEYLRSVRAERQTLPALLSRSGPSHARQTASDFKGFDEGEAFFVPAPGTTTPQNGRSGDPREAFTEALKERFLVQRSQLQLPPSAQAVAALDDKHPISCPPFNKKARAEWLDILASIPPKAAQVRAFDENAVFNLLELVQEHFLIRGRDINSVTSAWVWSLLARLIEVGLMDNDQVYAVRAFGKKAVLVQVSFRSAEAAQQLEEIANAEAGAQHEEVDEEEDVTVAPAHSDEDDSSKPAATRANTLATLDTILIIVGDIFRQRDLLEHRQEWEVDDNASQGT